MKAKVIEWLQEGDVALQYQMFINYACYFGEQQESLVSIVDFILDQQMEV